MALLRPAMTARPPGFRYEIQALRALAVAAVVLYHLWPATVRGGFVGVDVFFVISGFLITRQLVEEMARTGRISLTRFWARRIRRLLPAAFLVLATSLAILLILMPRVTWQNNLPEIRAAAAYFENWLLGIHAVDYLAAENSASLVQHYWSLSVEEQFYLVWPLLLLLVLAAGRSVTASAPRRLVGYALVVVGVGSFVVSVRMTAATPALAFFATQTRAWEFAAGGLVAVMPALAQPLRPLACWSGIAIICYSAVRASAGHPFPGSAALLPVAGAVLVLGTGTSAARWSPTTLARLRVVQWLGDNSYSIYLWHWPLIVAAPWVLHGPTTSVSKLVILAASLLLAAVTKRFVEDPVRTGPAWRVRRWPAYAFAVTGMAALVCVASVSDVHIRAATAASAASAGGPAPAAEPGPIEPSTANPGEQEGGSDHNPIRTAAAPRSCFGAAAMVPANRCSRPYARPAHLDTAFAAADGRSYACLQDTATSTPQFCTFGRTASPAKTIAVVGNSHARRLIPALDLYGKQHGWKIILAAKIDCMGLVTTAVGGQGPTQPCRQWSAAVQKTLLSTPRLDAVIFASHADAETYLAGPGAGPAAVALAEQRVLATWSTFARRGIRVIVTEDVPGMRPDSDPECIAMSGAAYDPCARDRAGLVRPNIMTSLALANPQLVSYVPLTKYFCDASKCHGLIGGVVVYFDSHHMTATYSRSLAPYLGAEVNSALASTR